MVSGARDPAASRSAKEAGDGLCSGASRRDLLTAWTSAPKAHSVLLTSRPTREHMQAVLSH